ncbi:MAG: TolC family protein [Betaproteobacteria bacterium]|nr:TolC family protein [Betaproteobacteria bacterium]
MPQPVPFRLARLIAAFALPAAVHAAPPLSLDEALRIAESRSAQLSAQRFSAEASASMALTAGENPDPKLIVGIENAPVEGPDKWSVTADGMTMRRIGVMQDFMRGEKRELMAARAQAEARRESALVDMQASDLRKEVAMVFLERLYAEQSIRLIDELSKEAELQVAGTTARLAAGRGDSAEPVMARANLAMLSDRRLEAERMARRAEARLSRWLGEDAKRIPAGEPDLDKLPRIAALTTDLENHPQLAMFAPMTAAADAEAKLAAVATKPDWSVELSYGARGSAYTNMVSLMFRMDLPVFAGSRQEPAAIAKAKQAEQSRALAEEARRRYESEVRSALVDLDIAKSRLARNEQEIVPLADARARASLAAYEGGRGDLAMVLESRRLLLEARLAALGVRAEAARAWAQLAYLIPERSPK